MKSFLVVFCVLLLAIDSTVSQNSANNQNIVRINDGRYRPPPPTDGRYRPVGDGRYRPVGDGKYRGGNDGRYVPGDDGKYKHVEGSKGPDGPPPVSPPGPPARPISPPTTTTTNRPTTIQTTTKRVTTTTSARPNLKPGNGNIQGGQGWKILELQHKNTKTDGYNYLFETENGILAEESGKVQNLGGDSDGLRSTGFYEYTGDDGFLYRVDYIADDRGFIPQGNHIPETPPHVKRLLAYLAEQGKL